MQTVTLTIGGWLRRLFVRNPLVRGSDRVEAFAILAVLVLAILAIPVAAAKGSAVYGDRIHASAEQRLTRHEVAAKAMRDSASTELPYRSSTLTLLQWQFAGRTHTEVVSTPDEMKAGELTSVWVDATGNRAAHSASASDAATQAVMAALGWWVTVAGAGVASYGLLRRRLDRARHAAWDRELDDLADDGTNRRSIE